MLKEMLVAAATLLATAANAAGPLPPSTYAKPARLVALPDGRKINLFCLGSGAPTVVLDAGWGSGMSAWAKVQPAIAETTRVCAFDRPGMGFSDEGPLPRDARAVVADERAALKAARVKGPYVLVGHSMAGLHVRLYASLYPKEVAGAVLVDPSNPHQARRFAEVAPKGAAMNDKMMGMMRGCADKVVAGTLKPGEPGFSLCFPPPPATLPEDVRAVTLQRQGEGWRYRMQASEVDSMAGSSSADIDRTRRPLGDLPWIVLTAEGTGKGPPTPVEEQAAMGQVWKAMHDEAAGLSTRGENRMVASGHNIQTEKPEAVIAAVNEVVAAVRAERR
ncbi:MAG: alpha/beta hydrolase [Phenylobacterium sp.]|uniref:alpha/beta fold hydrolase n=1 Tax=Phenylobacterium sp. TaxID=1871053 RepID=UPI0012022F24|nr:alpha/beta hydrolase [Phenylobacterium sp.]TAJ71259.1 MAG: alpha/beta hydrolase [Phenylobacterium sp.]